MAEARGPERVVGGARNVRPRVGPPVVVSPQQAFLDLWRPRAQAEFLMRGGQYIRFRPYAEDAARILDQALWNMPAVVNRIPFRLMAVVALSVPELAVENRETMEVLFLVNAWHARPVRGGTARGTPRQPWTALDIVHPERTLLEVCRVKQPSC